MKLIVGLGNPGEEYKNTRHNVGFMVMDKLAQSLRLKAQDQNLNLKTNKKFNAELGLFESSILLVKPQTFVNQSGEAIAKIANFYKILPEDIIVIHDDIDLPFGQLKIQKGGGTAGHHGLESIVQSLGTSDFIRFRVGIGRPEKSYEVLSIKYKEEIIKNYVLGDFTKEERRIMEKTIERVVEAIKYFLNSGLEKTMNKFN